MVLPAQFFGFASAVSATGGKTARTQTLSEIENNSSEVRTWLFWGSVA